MKRVLFFVSALLFMSTLVASAYAVQYIVPSNGASQSIGASNLLYLDNTNLKVGVNTTSPGSAFDVNGNATVRGLLYAPIIYQGGLQVLDVGHYNDFGNYSAERAAIYTNITNAVAVNALQYTNITNAVAINTLQYANITSLGNFSAHYSDFGNFTAHYSDFGNWTADKPNYLATSHYGDFGNYSAERSTVYGNITSLNSTKAGTGTCSAGTFVQNTTTGGVQCIAAGTVTSVGLSGGTTGLSVSGSPVTTSGTITLSGTLIVGNGGTGIATTTAYGLIAGGTTATGAFQNIGTGSAGQILRSGGASALPAWSTATYPSTAGSAGNILISDGTNFASTAMSGDVTITSGGVTTIGADKVALTTDTTGNYAAGDAEAGNALTGDSATAFFSSGTLEVARGGTGASTFTQGSVVFAGASGTYTQDNTNLFWDDTNNRLGINTAQPNNTLSVVGSLNVTGPFEFVSSASSTYTSFGMLWNISTAGGTSAPGIDGDANAIYVIGFNQSLSGQWIASINKTTGAYIWINETNTASTGARWVTGAIDSDRVYSGGYDGFNRATAGAYNKTTGAFIWNNANAYGGTSTQFTGVAVSSAGAYYVGFLINATDSFYDYLIVKKNLTSGSDIWSKQMMEAGANVNERWNGVDIDSTGLYVVGQNGTSAVLEKRNLTDASYIWGVTIPSGGSSSSAVATDGSGFVYTGAGVGRVYKYNATDGTQVWNVTVAATSIIKLSVNGSYLWAAIANGTTWAVERINTNTGSVEVYDRFQGINNLQASATWADSNGSGYVAGLNTTGSRVLAVKYDARTVNNYTGNAFTNNSLGIGTMNPNYPLHVVGNALSNYLAMFQNTGNASTSYGITVQAGAYDGSGTTYYLTANDGSGTITGYIQSSAGTFQLVDVSDRSTKTNIKTRDFDALSKVRSVDVVEYNRIKNPNGTKITGFVAQDLQKIYPEAVAVGPDGKLGVAKAELVPLLFKAIQEQQTQIDALAQGRPVQQVQQTVPNNAGGTPQGNDVIVNLGRPQDVVVTLG